MFFDEMKNTFSIFVHISKKREEEGMEIVGREKVVEKSGVQMGGKKMTSEQRPGRGGKLSIQMKVEKGS